MMRGECLIPRLRLFQLPSIARYLRLARSNPPTSTRDQGSWASQTDTNGPRHLASEDPVQRCSIECCRRPARFGSTALGSVAPPSQKLLLQTDPTTVRSILSAPHRPMCDQTLPLSPHVQLTRRYAEALRRHPCRKTHAGVLACSHRLPCRSTPVRWHENLVTALRLQGFRRVLRRFRRSQIRRQQVQQAARSLDQDTRRDQRCLAPSIRP